MDTTRVETAYDRLLASIGDRADEIRDRPVGFTEDMDAYALVVFVAFEPIGVIWFVRAKLGAIGARLGKRHPDQDRTLQLTHQNVVALMNDPAGFAGLGVRMWRPHDWIEGA